MSYKEFDSPKRTFGVARAIITRFGEGVDSFKIPTPKESERTKDSINSETSTFEFNNITYEINITSSNVGTYIILESIEDSDDINDLEIYIDYQDEEEYSQKSILTIDLYVPTLSYTNTTSSVLYDLVSSEKILPLIDIETIDKFNAYITDEMIDFKHFLDIYSMKEMQNRAQRENAKLLRKKEKKELGKMVTAIPKPIEKFINANSKTNYLKEIENKTNIIPIFKWDDSADLDDFKSFIMRLNGEYPEIGLRISSLRSFFNNISEISKIYDIHLILDLNTNFDKNKIKNLIVDIQEFSFLRIIYLGAQFDIEDITIPRDDTNDNIINSNQPLWVYESIFNDTRINKTIGYGDYCGFDKKTITEMPAGGRGTARVVLSSLDDSKKVLIRRGWDDADITKDKITGKSKLGYGKSMKKLLKDINLGELDNEQNSKFMDIKICDADISLKDFYPDITTPGIIKTLCFRHNVISIKHNYIED